MLVVWRAYMLVQAISRTRMRDTMPHLIEDIYDSIKQWGNRGHIDPFNALYAVRPTLATTLRSVVG